MRQLVSAEILFRPQDETTIFEIFDHNDLHALSAASQSLDIQRNANIE